MAAVQFMPQIMGYAALAVWASANKNAAERLGLRAGQMSEGCRWGLPTGLALGLLNVSVIRLVPRLGYDITFLQDTPHAHIPVAVMIPWVILLIGVAVELNFRGFLLGRLLALMTGTWRLSPRLGGSTAIALSALVFSFDPFMVATFKYLHWIAVWDGIVWGMIWIRTRNLFATIIAHTVEVIVMYTILKIVLVG